ncbi:hypothetical protein Dip510_001268 [Elusimicrobium posterum]|uniref:hypothetical protein n=1 Tax=Elusimicrobium posterum TaxID=3116653 RepID=UPI003C762A16
MLKRNTVLLAALFVFIFNTVAFASAKTAKQLELAKNQFNEGDYDAARDNFIDVMMSGTPKESAEANIYINKIHNAVGNVQEPTFVDDAANAAKSAQAQAQTALQQQQQALEQQRQALLQQQQELEAQRQAIQQSAANAQANAQQTLTDAQLQAQQQALAAQQQANAQALAAQQSAAATAASAAAAAAAQQQAQEEAIQLSPRDVEYAYYASLDPNSYEAKAKRDQITASTVYDIKSIVVEELQKTKGVKIYFRNNDVDAIDMDSSVIFADSNNFSISGKKTLDLIYTLMILSPNPSFVVLPPGSYTDKVTLPGVKQAVSLSTYFIYKGVSPAKLSYNMGLYNQQPPAKFSNLDGLSIVFDYDAVPELEMSSSGEKLPLMSLGIIPSSMSIKEGTNTGLLFDYSVIQTANPISRWYLQIIQHSSDGGYYIVRQVEGAGPVYNQTYWNGRKNFFGELLPAGKYTVMLTAIDSNNQSKVLRRSVEITAAQTTTKKASSSTAKASALNYKAKRLWTRPGRRNFSASANAAANTPTQTTTPENNFPSEAPADPYGAGTYDPYGAGTTDPGAQQQQPGVTDPYGAGTYDPYYYEDEY